jgi:aldose 1-epimerase
MHTIENDYLKLTADTKAGFRLKNLSYRKNDTWVNLIEDPKGAEVSTWFPGTHLFPFPNRLKDGKFDYQGKTYQLSINDESNNNALHGLVYDRNWEVTTQDKYKLSGFFELNTPDQFPSRSKVEVTYLLNGSTLEIEVKVGNMGDSMMPFGYGFHPYFSLGTSLDQVDLQLPECRRILLDERSLPVDQPIETDHFKEKKKIVDTEMDNCYVIEKAIGEVETIIADEQKGLKVSVKQDANHFPYLQVFTHPERGHIAIEPMTCGVDALNTGRDIIQLDPRESWKGQFSISVEKGSV